MNAEPAVSLRDPSLYANRELSQLDFNFRVLAQAQDPSVPLLERLRFLCISCTNLDEFFEIRAATVRHAQDFGLPPGADGMSPATVLNKIHDRAAELLGTPPERCIVFEDSPTGVEAGRRAGMRVAGVGTHQGSLEGVEIMAPDFRDPRLAAWLTRELERC